MIHFYDNFKKRTCYKIYFKFLPDSWGKNQNRGIYIIREMYNCLKKPFFI